MVKKKKANVFGYMIGLPASAIAIGALPDTTPGVAGIKTNVLGGMSNLSRSAKPIGRLLGTKKTLEISGNINQALKKIK